MEQLLEYDHELFLYLNNLGTCYWDNFWLFVTDKVNSGPLYALLLYFIYKNFGAKGLLISVFVVALMITCTDQLANLFKHGFERPRPCRVEEWRDLMRAVAERCGRYGFFSAHAASTMAAAVFAGLALQSKYRYLIFILLFWSAVVGYSRVYLGVHYPGDVIIGWIIGGTVGWVFYKLFITLNTKYGDRVIG